MVNTPPPENSPPAPAVPPFAEPASGVSGKALRGTARERIPTTPERGA